MKRVEAFLTAALLAAPLWIGAGQAARPVEVSAPLSPPAPDSAFVGSQTCRGCHASTHSSWSNGRHSRMLQEARPGSVLPVFARSVTLRGKEYRLEREGDSYFIIEDYLQDVPTRRRVDYTLGSRRVQHYLSRLSDGRIVVLPPSYDVEKKEWFHNLDIVDLEESSAVKVQVWNTNCFGCHVSGEEKGFDPATKTYRTTWTDFGTSCERCHGPGRPHATKYAARKAGDQPRTGEAAAALSRDTTSDPDTAILHPRRVDSETSTTLCAQCHSLRDITQPGFSGGANYYDYFTPLLEYSQKRNRDPAWWPNGRPRRFSNEALAFWQSQCFFKGGATCLSCHQDVHEPDIDKNTHLAAKQDSLCSGCHREIAKQGSKHSRHETPRGETDTKGAVSCISCHMPRTTISLRHRMPDHTISVPAPENTSRFSIPNACNECHKDKSPDWSEARLAEWFPKGRRGQTVADAVAFTGGARKDPSAISGLARIAGDLTRPPLFRANALGHLRNFTDPVAIQSLLGATADPHPAVRLAAVLSLVDRGQNGDVRSAMEALLKDPRRTIRMASALGVLNATAPPQLQGHPPQGLAAAIENYADRARFLSEDPATQLDLGKMLFLSGNWKGAESALRDALKLDPAIPGGHYFLGLSTLGQGRVKEGTELLRGVSPKDPHRKDADSVLARLSVKP